MLAYEIMASDVSLHKLAMYRFTTWLYQLRSTEVYDDEQQPPSPCNEVYDDGTAILLTA